MGFHIVNRFWKRYYFIIIRMYNVGIICTIQFWISNVYFLGLENIISSLRSWSVIKVGKYIIEAFFIVYFNFIWRQSEAFYLSKKLCFHADTKILQLQNMDRDLIYQASHRMHLLQYLILVSHVYGAIQKSCSENHL